jgi:hypothetical protein
MLPMSSIPDMGTEQDMSQRQILARVDNDTQRNKILDALRLVYEKNYAITSPHIQKLLKDESLIPTLVGVSAEP